MPDYGSMLKADLEAEATKRGIDISDSPLKDELVRRLEAYDADQEAAQAPAETPPEASTEAEQPPDTGPPGTFDDAVLAAHRADHLPTPYPDDGSLQNAWAAANTPELSQAPPPTSDFE